jgi:hypothetical protein
MSISEILKQIDTEIARLKQVRGILSGKLPPPKPAAKRTRFAAVRQPIGNVPRRPRAVKKAPVVTVLEPVVRRTRAARPRAIVPAITALTAAVPRGPIAISSCLFRSDLTLCQVREDATSFLDIETDVSKSQIDQKSCDQIRAAPNAPTISWKRRSHESGVGGRLFSLSENQDV